MPEYTKMQIAAHVDNLHEGEFPCDCGYVWTVKESCAPKTITCPMCGRVHKNPILSALSTAEQERDEKQNYINEHYTKAATAYIKELEAECCIEHNRAEKSESERDALAARCAELEARVQGAAERGVEYVRHNLKEIWDNGTAKLRAAILGEKKE